MQISPNILYQCYRAFYLPENMILCVCGDVSEEIVISAVNDTVPSGLPHPAEPQYPAEPKTLASRRSDRKMAISKPLFAIGIKDNEISSSPEERMKKAAAMRLISSLYFGRSSELYSRLLNDGLISPSFSCWCQHTALYSFIMISGDSDRPDEVYDHIMTYIDETAKKPIPRNELERARRAVYSHFVKSFDSTEEIAGNLVCGFAIDGGDIFRYAEILREITPEYVEDVLSSVLKSEYCAMSVITPQ